MEWNLKIWHNNVITNFDFKGLDKQIRNKVNEIAQNGPGAGNEGLVKVDMGGSRYQQMSHWRAGDLRIFGYFDSDKKFNFVGYGPHTGKDNSQYRVHLGDGKTTNATTS